MSLQKRTPTASQLAASTIQLAPTASPTMPHLPDAAHTLSEALAACHIDLPVEQVELLDRYRMLLWQWNEQVNLTRHTSLEKFVTRDVVDSLALAELLGPGEKVLDMGTGGGVPGLVLAICRPDLRLSVCDSTQKKARIVSAMVAELGLSVQVFDQRVEAILPAHRFDTLVARGLAPLGKILGWLAPHWKSFRQVLLIKGQRWVEERGAARHRGLLRGLALRKAAAYATPGHDSESVILSVRAEAGKAAAD